MFFLHADFFWLFILAIVLGGIVSKIIRTNQREKTIRAAIDKGVALDPATLSSIQAGDATGSDRPYGLLTGAIITFFVGCGLIVMGYFISLDDASALHPLLGVGGMMWFIGLGMLVAYFAITRRAK
jgi:Domain of unknown function (DUF6249)